MENVSNVTKLENQLKMGLTLVIDYNEERQIDISSKNIIKDAVGHSFSFLGAKS